jgi:uncharacterized peroxidase-related enzyme
MTNISRKFMTNIPILRPEQASTATNAVYEEFHRRMSFPAPPNFIMTQGHSSTTARGTWEAVRNILVSGEIPRWKKELIFVAISKDRNCKYCYAAHVACCRMLGVESGTIDVMIRDVSLLPDAVLRDMIMFCQKCARDPQSLGTEDYDVLRKCGLKQSEIMELVAMSALAVYANIIADATAMEPDAMFESIGAGK